MSLKFALLGLISIKPASGYDLKRTIERSIYFIWNATSPQIYNTLRKLREDGYITTEELPQQGKPDKQIHTITQSGRTALEEFLSEPIRSYVTRDEVLLRIFLGNFADPDAMHRELMSYLERVREERAYLESVEARIGAHPGPNREARRYQLLSLRIKVAQSRATERELRAYFKSLPRKTSLPASEN
ncbi:MAG: PadR family transcriptional regulator [Rhodobiaceae bacterium]|nr:PadR family transcriptional regulator [Rhodobiaceae bacterium]MCC0014555.1 PadR family transcriptional regulator [Rhodobiaceae bacterium]MCC0052116.1 PadR family transcriptional regulator [Rhodobiaceae bacterium]MCC0061364.1 PadR family transcriptional regulator [Rhodobiaceae bacterium]